MKAMVFRMIFLFCFLLDRVPPCSPGCLGTHRPGLPQRSVCLFLSDEIKKLICGIKVLGLKVCTTTARLRMIL